MPIYSHSKIISYETCPLRYKYAYIDKIKPEAEETAESFLGARVHEALEKLYRNKGIPSQSVKPLPLVSVQEKLPCKFTRLTSNFSSAICFKVGRG